MARTSKKQNDDYEQFRNSVNNNAIDWGNKYDKNYLSDDKSNNITYETFRSSVTTNADEWGKKYNTQNTITTDNSYSSFKDKISKNTEAFDTTSQKKSKNIFEQLFEEPTEEEKAAKEAAKKAKKEAKEKQDFFNKQAQTYYESNKSILIKNRNKELVYDWYLGGHDSSLPIQNEQGYFKMTDDFGNTYWEDAVNKKIYNDQGELVKDNSNTKSFSFSSNGLNDPHKYVYDDNAAKILKVNPLLKFDKADYKYLYTDSISTNATHYYDYDAKIDRPVEVEDKQLMNKHTDEGWIIVDGRYYRPLGGKGSNISLNGNTNNISLNNTNQVLSYENPITKQTTYLYSDEDKQNDPRIKNYLGQDYVLVFDEIPRTVFDTTGQSTVKKDYQNVYEEYIEKFNTAIDKGDYTAANNAIEYVNYLYFGYNYENGAFKDRGNTESEEFFKNRFNTNVEKLNVINDSLKNTTDKDLINELNDEKSKLEFENRLIQYNRITMNYANEGELQRLEGIMSPVDESWSKTGNILANTFEEFENGYDFGDIFRTSKNIVNDGLQILGSTGKMVNASFSGTEALILNDMDEGAFKNTWGPAIIDVGTYLIPLVGQARMWINYAEPGSVVGAGLLQEESATINSDSENGRIPTLTNVAGAAANIAANFISDKIFKDIRSSFSPGQLEKWYQYQGQNIFYSILGQAGAGEGIEEFTQTFAEYMQNADEGEKVFTKEHFWEACEAGLIAFVTSSGAKATGITIGKIRSGSNINAENIRINSETDSIKSEINSNVKVNEDIKVNEDLSEKSNTTTYVSTDTKEYADINYDSDTQSDVITNVDGDATLNIATELQNGNIVTILDSDIVKSNKNIDLNDTNGKTILSNVIVNDNIKTVLVPSTEMETYLKNLRDDLTIYTFDPKDKNFMYNINEYLNSVGKSNIVTKNVTDFKPSDYKLSPDEMTEINKMVTEAINRGNFVDAMNDSQNFKLDPITVSDISDSDLNTIMNSIKTKFLNEVDNGRISKESYKREFKQLNTKLSEYAQKTKSNRYYIKDAKNNIISFVKKGNNLYEALDTMPTRDAELETFANVQTNGNIINGNLNKKVDFSKKNINAVNTLIDKLKLKGNFVTSDSTYKDIASLLKQNRDMSGEILQALGADGLIEGKNKVRLYTAFDNLDNANPTGAIKNTTELISREDFKTKLKAAMNTTAPEQIKLPLEQSKVSVEEKPINTKKYAYNPEETTELNNIEIEQKLDEIFDNLKIKDKVNNLDVDKLKTDVRKLLFDRYIHINDIAKANDDYNTREAIASYEAVASDAQQMIKGAQIINNEVVGKSLDQIYKDYKLKGKLKDAFEKYMLLELNIERENAGVDKIFENLSKNDSRKLADKLLKRHPAFSEAAKDLQRYNNNLLDMLVDGGLITEEVSNKLKNRYKFYMPIYSSELSTFADLNNDTYLKNMKVDNTIKDVTKTGKEIQSLRASLENKTYNVLNAIAKNKLANSMADNGNYTSTGNADLLYYTNGQPMKIKTSKEIIGDINGSNLSHIADRIHQIPVIKQMIDASNMSYRFILDPVYQLKNIIIDYTDSQLIYSKDKTHFSKNYARAAIAIANNSEVFNEFKEVGLAEWGTGINAPKVTYDVEGNVKVKQNKFQRLYANLEAMPKLAEYLSLKDRYMKQARLDYEAGKYTKVDNHLEFNDDENYAIKQWSGATSYIINQHYRDGTNIDDRTQKIADGMDEVLNKIKSESGIFNRSITLEGNELQDFINKYQKGKIVTEDAFTSMSKDIVYDDSFNVQMKIKSNNAKDTTKLMRSDENEFMLKRGSQFRVDKVNVINPISKQGQDFNTFNENIVKGHNGKPVYISRHTSSPNESEYINTYKQNNIDNYGLWYANSPTGDNYYNSDEANKFINNLFDKSTANMIKDKKGVFATISEKRLTPPSKEQIESSGRYNYIEGYLTGKIFDISSDEGYLPFDVSNESEINTNDKFNNLEQKRRDTVTQIYTNLKNKYDKNNQYSLDDFRKYIPLVDALKLDGYTGIVNDYNNGTKEIIVFDESKFMPLKEYNELSNKNTTVELELTDITKDLTTIYKNNVSMNDIQEQAKLRAKIDAQDVNLNFNSGGTLAKAMSKSGFKFLNAGMLGFDKFVTHVSEGMKTPKGMGSLLFEFTSIGIGTAVANAILNGDDEEYDKLPYYYKNNYYMIKVGDGQYIRVPKGRVQALYNVLFEYGTGIRTEDSTKDYLSSIQSAFDLAVLPPDFNTAAPWAMYQAIISNKDAFGNEIYSEKYDSTGQKIKKGTYHLLSSYFGRYGRMVKDITDGDSTTDWFNELEYYKDTTKANRHYSTALNLVEHYQDKDNVKTFEDRIMKKYIDTQNYNLRTINSEINQGKKAGQTTQDLKMKYAARDDLLLSMINNYKNYDIEELPNGNKIIYFDDLTFEYNAKTDKITKKK